MTQQGGPGDEETVSLVVVVNFFLRWRHLLFRFAGAGFVLGVLFALLRPATFTSTSAFGPRANSGGTSLAGLSGLAAQFGVQVPTQDAAQSPDFYVALLQSREILGRAGLTSYGPATEGRRLVEYYGIAQADSNLSSERAVTRLLNDVDAVVDPKTEIIQLSVRAPTPALARALNTRILELLDDFNLGTRQSQARAERRFAEERMGAVRDSLRGAEDRLESFLQRNRDFRNSPELAFQQDRLARDLAFQQQLYVTLAQAYEKAKLDEVRDTPVLTILEHPSLPARRDPRRLVQRALLGALLGGVFALLLAGFRELRSGLARGEGADIEELRALLVATRRDAAALRDRFRTRNHRSGP